MIVCFRRTSFVKQVVQLMFDKSHRSTSIRMDLKPFYKTSRSQINIMQIAFALHSGYVTPLYKLSLLLLIRGSYKVLSVLCRQYQSNCKVQGSTVDQSNIIILRKESHVRLDQYCVGSPPNQQNSERWRKMGERDDEGKMRQRSFNSRCSYSQLQIDWPLWSMELMTSNLLCLQCSNANG